MSINPGNINAGNGSVFTQAITSSNEYQSALQDKLRQANAAGQTSMTNVQLPLNFQSGDAMSAFGKLDIYVNATRDKNGTWQVSAKGSDKYDFAYMDYKNKAVSTVNNTAYFGQKSGAVSNFTTNLNFTQAIPLSQQTFVTPSGGRCNVGWSVSFRPAEKELKTD